VAGDPPSESDRVDDVVDGGREGKMGSQVPRGDELLGGERGFGGHGSTRVQGDG